MHRLALMLVCGSALACSTPERPAPPPMTAADSQAAHVRDVVASGGVVDSILPVPEMLRRFQATIPQRADSLGGGSSSSRRALVERFAHAIATQDTAQLNAMLIDRAEFAWLYYPESKMSKPPYEAPPGLLWDQMLAASDEGIRKVLTKFAGKQLPVASLKCGPATADGRNRLHGDCSLAGESVFSTIIERDGRFKFLSYANAQ